jgi:hypothetical protein
MQGEETAWEVSATIRPERGQCVFCSISLMWAGSGWGGFGAVVDQNEGSDSARDPPLTLDSYMKSHQLFQTHCGDVVALCSVAEVRTSPSHILHTLLRWL